MRNHRFLVFVALLGNILFPSCSDTSFTGEGKKNSPDSGSRAGCPNPPNLVHAKFAFDASGKALNLSADFERAEVKEVGPCQFEVKLNLKPGSLVTDQNAEFPEATGAQIKSLQFALRLNITGAQNIVTISLNQAGAPSADLTQTSNNLQWSKDEGLAAMFGTTTTPGTPALSCRIESSGNQPTHGVHSVILTRPAGCDFKLPSVKVGRDMNLVSVPVGTYWIWAGGKSHNFPTVNDSPFNSPNAQYPPIDNGFILVQPDHKSYLLADAGFTMPNIFSAKSAQEIAEEISQTLGFGSTTLLQPTPGSPADNYATATQFKKDSVIALYDDTPDMGGNIDVEALIASAQIQSGVNLKWTAEAR